MSEEVRLVKPSIEYLDSYLECLRRGWNPMSLKESLVSYEKEIADINADSTKFFKQILNITGGGEPFKMDVVLTLYSSTAGMFKLPIVSP